VGLTVAVLVAELAHLAWEHLHGGIVSHHLLDSADLPTISNAWGVVLLPALAWFASGRVEQRAAGPGRGRDAVRLPPSVITGSVASALLGVLVSVAFSQGYDTLAAWLFLGTFVLAVLAPVHRAELLLGFVLGMTLTFGAVLPTLIGSVVAAVSAVVHLGVRPLLARLWRALRQGAGARRARSHPAG
jgi:hypothetical protein